MRSSSFLAAGVFLAANALNLGCAAGRDAPVGTADELAERLVGARPGDVIAIAAGTIALERGLSLSVDGVTLRGAGKTATVLDFGNQAQGAEGLLVTASDFRIEGLTIRNAKGDALKISDGRNIVVRDVRAEWSRGPSPDNGAYGIYPVQCENVLIERAEAFGASDAGIYVGQSKHIVVRHSKAEFNVAGIEIENSSFADVHDNLVTRNTAGILVFDLPNLPVQGGHSTRVFRNRIVDNDTDNFAPPGNIVATVPTGTGVMINSNDRIEVFDNDIAGNGTANLLIISYHTARRPFDDPKYDPYPETIHVHGNRFGRGGFAPDSPPLAALHERIGSDLPDILWDGFVDPARAVAGVLPPEARICVRDNGAALFANLDAPHDFAAPSFDAAPHACEHAPLAAVELAL